MNAAQKLLQSWQPPVRLPPVPRTTTVFGRVLPVPNGTILPQPVDYPYVAKDKLGDGFHISRGSPIPRRCRPSHGVYTGEGLRLIRRYYGVGRPAADALLPVPIHEHTAPVQATSPAPPSYADAVRLYGSQRKAATALGITLGKLQRGLRK